MAIRSRSILRYGRVFVAIMLLAGLMPQAASAAEGTISVEQVSQGLDTVWVLLGAFLVFFMQAGFGMVEAGFIRAKNACNILTKNFLDFCMASLGFFLIGYGLMFGDGNGFLGLEGWCLAGLEPTESGVPSLFRRGHFVDASSRTSAGWLESDAAIWESRPHLHPMVILASETWVPTSASPGR